MRTLGFRDVWIAGGLVLLAFGFGFLHINFAVPPFEDAAMLMRYAEHVAGGYGVVWNVGERPVDGATDFLFMMMVAGLRYVGLTLETAVRALTLTSHGLNILLIYFTLRGMQGAGRFAAAISALYFALGPGLHLAAAYFGAPVFALSISVAWVLVQSMILRERCDPLRATLFSIACLVTGLIRPEGVLFGVLFLAAVWVGAKAAPQRDKIRLAALFVAFVFLLGGVYFVWRWNYFGHPLPNPFYKKAGGHFYPRSLAMAALENVLLTLPFLGAFVLGWRHPRTRRLAVAFAVPIVGSTLMWGLLSDEMNFAARFQYPTLALIVLSWRPLVDGAWTRLQLHSPRLRSLSPRDAAAWAILFGVATVAYGAIRVRGIGYAGDGRFEVARYLGRYADRNFTLLTTEAGLLPLYSGWRSIDAWGLNDPWIVQHGGITKDYVAAQHPDVIVIHTGLVDTEGFYGQAWDQMTDLLDAYAKANNFVLAAAYCVRLTSAHLYYVRKDMPDSAEIIAGIRNTPYPWFGANAFAHNCAPEPDAGAAKTLTKP